MEQKREDVVEKRLKFRHKQKRLKSSRLVFLDETGVNRAMRKARAWARRGQRAISFRPGSRGKNFTIMGAVRQRGTVALKTISRAMTAVIFYRFLRFCVLPRLRPGDVLVMDNLAAHRGEHVRNLIRDHGVHILYTPPYSPEFNPIEMVWNSLKRRVERRMCDYMNRIAQGVAAAWKTLRKLDIGKLMAACGYQL